MNRLERRYARDGIWTMADTRSTCVVPDRPLLIDQAAEREYNELCLAVWRATESLIDYVRTGTSENASRLKLRSGQYPEGMSMPPAIRIDTVLGENGPKIVEVDPSTAISLGETASLASIWREEGYDVPSGLTEAVTARIKRSGGRLNMAMNDQSSEYKNELSLFASSLEEEGVSMSDAPGTLRLNQRGGIGGSGWDGTQNPLWGSLVDISKKDNLRMLLSMDKTRLAAFLPATYEVGEVEALADETTLIAKPINATGSRGIVPVLPRDVSKMPQGYIFQEFVQPMIDSFGVDSEDGSDKWVSRVSVYAGRYGLIGAQVTARPFNGGFTNAHGQADAIQTTLAFSRSTK